MSADRDNKHHDPRHTPKNVGELPIFGDPCLPQIRKVTSERYGQTKKKRVHTQMLPRPSAGKIGEWYRSRASSA